MSKNNYGITALPIQTSQSAHLQEESSNLIQAAQSTAIPTISEHREPQTQSFRQYKHSLSKDGGVQSLCMLCGEFLAPANDEWTLLEHEQRPRCSRANQ